MFSTPSLPAPIGPFQVGYQDVMTPGKPPSATYFRIHYPAPTYTSITNPPVWADRECQEGLLKFMQKMVWEWPSWVNNSEFLLLPLAKKIMTEETFFSTFNLGWNLTGRRLTIPICKAAPLAQQPSSGWPVVVFSHGMGCNRFTMSNLCYQLASMGVIVVAIEHREGSGWGTKYKLEEGEMKLIPHLQVSVNECEYEVRNNQMNLRCEEVIKTIQTLDKINEGKVVFNVANDDNSNDEMKHDLKIFKSSLDLKKKLHLMGHSFGGSTVLLVSTMEKRIRSVLALDPWMFPVSMHQFTLDKPVQVIHTEKFVKEENLKVIKEASKNIEVEFKVFKAGVHLSATDIPFVFSQPWLRYLRKGLGMTNDVEPDKVMVDTNMLIWDWMKKTVA